MTQPSTLHLAPFRALPSTEVEQSLLTQSLTTGVKDTPEWLLGTRTRLCCTPAKTTKSSDDRESSRCVDFAHTSVYAYCDSLRLFPQFLLLSKGLTPKLRVALSDTVYPPPYMSLRADSINVSYEYMRRVTMKSSRHDVTQQKPNVDDITVPIQL